jgi:hypothetical protein
MLCCLPLLQHPVYLYFIFALLTTALLPLLCCNCKFYYTHCASLLQGVGVALIGDAQLSFQPTVHGLCTLLTAAVLYPHLLLQGVGVALFGDAGSANEACAQLTGVQADGRKLELVLMSPENHISFSCKQVSA